MLLLLEGPQGVSTLHITITVGQSIFFWFVASYYYYYFIQVFSLVFRQLQKFYFYFSFHHL